MRFNPRTREGCDWDRSPRTGCGSECFNPRTREGCDLLVKSRINIVCIVSIHAPVKGATDIGLIQGAAETVSIHAAVKGATTMMCGYIGLRSGFNPRTREGCDGVLAAAKGTEAKFQSTHP